MGLRSCGRRRGGLRRCVTLLVLSSVVLVTLWRWMPDSGEDDESISAGTRSAYRGPCPRWCYGTPKSSRHRGPADKDYAVGAGGIITRERSHFVTAVISVRVYPWKDPAGLGTEELVQWLRYLSFAGVEHVYLYDAYAFRNESQSEAMRKFVESGYLTYTDWHHRAVPFSLEGTQAAAYRDCLNRWGRETSWQLAVDMDEYPFSPTDQEPGFLARYLRRFEARTPQAERVSELGLQNFLFLGKEPLGSVDRHPLLMIDRIRRRTRTPPNGLSKSLYRTDAVRWAGVHRNALRYGESRLLPAWQLRLNHYWGARRLRSRGGARRDPRGVLDLTSTVEDRSVAPIVANLMKCDSCGENYTHR